MFLRITAATMLILLPLYATGAINATDIYDSKEAKSDLEILESIHSRHPEDLKNLRRIVELSFSLEEFGKTGKYCDIYLSIEKESGVAYIKIIAAASEGKFKEAADMIDPFIKTYRSELNSRDIKLLKYREEIYRKSSVTYAYPAGSEMTSWGNNILIKSPVPRDGLYLAYDTTVSSHNIFILTDQKSKQEQRCPVYLEGLPFKSINFVSLSHDGREVLASSSSGNRSGIYTRRYIAEEKKWSQWDKPENLNPGDWNHFPNFVDSRTVIFSSNDGMDFDLFIAQKEKDGTWGKARKLEGINTPLDEISVYLHPDGKTLCFASDGYEGMGGFDMYMAILQRKGESFEVTGIKNVTGANTFRNEKYPLFIAASGDRAYFNFRIGMQRDVYLCKDIPYRPEPVFFYCADVVDGETGNPVSIATADYRDADGAAVFTGMVQADGYTGTSLFRKRKYTFTITAEGYESITKKISYIGNADTVRETIRLKKTAAKKTEEPGGEITVLVTTLRTFNCGNDILKPAQSLLEKFGGDTAQVRIIKDSASCGDEQCAIDAGKKSGAAYVIIGSITAKKESGMETLGDSGGDQYLARKVTGTVYTVELRLVEVSTGRVIVTARKSVDKADAIKRIVAEFLKKAAAAIIN